MSVSDPKTIKEWEASNLINREEKNQILRIIIYRLFLEHSLDIPRVSCSLIWEVHVLQRIVSGIPQSISLPLERGVLIYFESLLYSSKAKITELIEQPSKRSKSGPKTLQAWELISFASLLFSVPVLIFSYYNIILFGSALRYPKSLRTSRDAPLANYPPPKISILVAVYNEKQVIGRTIDAISKLDYPRDRIQLIIADDSTDETRFIIDEKVSELSRLGMESQVSRRSTRDDFKAGALRRASSLLSGKYVLLLDADSIVPSDVLIRGLEAFENHRGIEFVSFRVGHYNRHKNIVTSLFALSLDMGDTLTKMGSYSLGTPFSFQGGFVMISRDALERAGFWSGETITEDADVSCKLWCLGMRGIYLSNVRIMSEDPPTLEIWKKQAARVAQGWAGCLRAHWKTIISTRKLSFPKKIALFLVFLAPFASLSWITVNFLSAFSVVFGLSAPSNSIFSNPIYIALVSIPTVFYFASALFALHVQKIVSPRNLLMIPMLSYIGVCMMTASSAGFLSGLLGKTGEFFRTPKNGLGDLEEKEEEDEELGRGKVEQRELGKRTADDYFDSIQLDRVSTVEVSLSILALALSVIVGLRGVVFLAISLLGFGALTLLSVNLPERLSKSRRKNGASKIETSKQEIVPKIVKSRWNWRLSASYSRIYLNFSGRNRETTE